MFCRNCGNEVHDKAIACPKCGVNPRSERNHCPACGVETKPNQIMCVQCGISLGGQKISFDKSSLPNLPSLPKVDLGNVTKDKSVIFAAIGFFGCFLPWVKVKTYIALNLNLFKLSEIVDVAPDTILISPLLYLLPFCLGGVALASFLPQIARYKEVLSIVSLILIAYIAVGLYMAANMKAPEVSNSGDAFSQGMNNALKYAQKAVMDAVSIGYGFYITTASVIASFIFGRK